MAARNIRTMTDHEKNMIMTDAIEYIAMKQHAARNLAYADKQYTEYLESLSQVLRDLGAAKLNDTLRVLRDNGMRLERGSRWQHDASVDIRECLDYLYRRYTVNIWD